MKHPDGPLDQRACFPLAKRLAQHGRYRRLKRRLARSRFRYVKRLSLWLTPKAPEPGPTDIEIISMRAIVAGGLTLPYEVRWRGAIHAFELNRAVHGAREPGRAEFHQAVRSYFTASDEVARERLERIGYELPSLDEGDIVLLGTLAFIVTREGEFKLATHNRALAWGAPLLKAALRDETCALPAY
jgi:hypothetical protein